MKPPYYTIMKSNAHSKHQFHALEFPTFETLRKDERFDKVCFSRFLPQLRFSASARGDDALFHLLLQCEVSFIQCRFCNLRCNVTMKRCNALHRSETKCSLVKCSA